MITWITGWPHNGSTLVRQIMKDSLGLQTYSLYAEPNFKYLFGDLVEEFARNWGTNPQFRLEYFRDRPEMYYIKTHNPPLFGDDSRAIYVLRDGRDCMTALSQFWTIPIRSAIAGVGVQFGGFSEHYYTWDPENRPNTTVVRFEDMVNVPNMVVDNLVDFLGVKKIADYVDDFEENVKVWPKLFHDRIGCWKKRMSAADIALFDKCHGQLMREVGYYE